jgi:hypothetical protein
MSARKQNRDTPVEYTDASLAPETLRANRMLAVILPLSVLPQILKGATRDPLYHRFCSLVGFIRYTFNMGPKFSTRKPTHGNASDS